MHGFAVCYAESTFDSRRFGKLLPENDFALRVVEERLGRFTLRLALTFHWCGNPGFVKGMR